MSPKQKLLNDRLISIVTIALFALLSLVILVFILTEIEIVKRTPIPTSSNYDQQRPLTPAEVADERSLLPQYQIPVPPTDSEAPIAYVTDAVTPVKETADPLPSDLAATIVTNDSPNTSQNTIQAYVKENSGVLVKNAGVNTETPQTMATIVLEGKILLTDGRMLRFYENRTKATQDVIFTPETKVSINNKPINPSDLKSGDVLRIEGDISPVGNLVYARVVALVGETEVVTTTEI